MKQQPRKLNLMMAGGMMIAGMFAGCNGGSGGGGSSTITGTVESFDGAAVNTGLTASFAGAVRANIRVRVVDTNLETTTADDGLFVISGVSAGLRELRYEFGGSVASQAVDVPENAIVALERIRIRDGEVRMDQVRVQHHASDAGSSSDDDRRGSNSGRG